MSAIIKPYEHKYLQEIKDIFFESSTKKEFKNDADKEVFYQKYLGYYLKHFSDLVFIAVTDKVLGYVVASPVSDNAELWKLQPHMKTFQDHFELYPSHLHINCHHEARGQGIGSKLMLEMEKRLKELKITGLHIMTGPDSVNKAFYYKLGFSYSIEQDFQGSTILFMGKRL